jgi:ATP-dependent Zn protease
MSPPAGRKNPFFFTKILHNVQNFCEKDQNAPCVGEAYHKSCLSSWHRILYHQQQIADESWRYFWRNTMATDQLGPDTTPQPRNAQHPSGRNRFWQRGPWKLARVARWSLVLLFLAWAFWVTLPNLVNFLVTPGTPGLFILLFLFIEVILIVFLGGTVYLFYRFTTRTHSTWIRPGTTRVSFADYRGNPAVLDTARYLVTLLTAPRTTPVTGFPGGILLRGLSGTGRRYLAQAIATEARLPLGCLSLAPLSMARLGRLRIMLFYRRARKLAREYGACIVFLDGLDALPSASNILNELLFQLNPSCHPISQLDRLLHQVGLARHKPYPPLVLTFAAILPNTSLDPALLHPQRFARTISVSLPDTAGRREILINYLNQVQHAPLPLERILAETSHFTPRALRQMIDAAAMCARAAGRSALTYADITYARTPYGADTQPVNRLPYIERRRIAYYAAGQVYAQRKLLPRERWDKLILTYTPLDRSVPEQTYTGQIVTREELLTAIQIRLAGRATEEELLSTPTNIAEADLRQATLMTAHLAGAWGMDQQRGTYLPGITTAAGEMLLRDGELRVRIEAILQEQYLHVRQLIADNNRAVMLLAEALILCNELIATDIDVILAQAEQPLPFVPSTGEF